MTTAAEALEEVLALIRLQGDDEALWFVAITAPEGYLQYQLRMLHEVIETHAATLRAALATPQAGEVEECIRLLQAYLPVRTLGEEAQHGGLPETLRMAIRLLRATQSNAPAPSAPAQEPAYILDPRNGRWDYRHPGMSKAIHELYAYAAPPQDEAVALLREAYNALIVDPEQDEATRAVGDALVERIRAYLESKP